jgi:positive regulator of sigma E activity
VAVTKSRIEKLIYLIILMWFILGIVCFFTKNNYEELSTYFLALTGFIGVYVFGEKTRSSEKTPMFTKGKNSSREMMIYIVSGVWFILGILCLIFTGLSLSDIGAYFATLTPFVGSYILGETYKPEIMKIEQVKIEKSTSNTNEKIEDENKIDL